MGAETDVEEARRARGFLDVRQTAALARRGIIVLEPHTTLVAAAAVLEPGVVLWPGTIVEVGMGGGIAIRAGTVLFPGTRIAAPAGRVSIGRHAEIGEEGGFTIKADAAEVTITIGDHTRLLGGGSLTSSNDIGDGAQVLGPIRMQGCCLGAVGAIGIRSRIGAAAC